MRFDRAPQPLGFARRWVVETVDTVAWCPGDRELVVAGGGSIRWVSAVHGRVVGDVEVPGVPEGVDCRADGTALTVVDGTAVLVGRDRKLARSPAGVTGARFADDGSVRYLDAKGYTKWDGTTVEHLADVALPAFVVEHGGLVSVHDKALWLTPATGAPKKLERWREEGDDDYATSIGELKTPALTDDGVLVGLADGSALAWPGKKKLVISGSLGAMSAYASTKWFVFTMGDELWTQHRPDLAYAHIQGACGRGPVDRDWATPLPAAISHDGKQLVLSCGDVLGLRVYDLASLSVVAGRNPLPLAAAAWSGDRLATRDIQGHLQLWRDGVLERTIDTGYDDGRMLWWWGDDIASEGGMAADETTRWSSKTGKRGKPTKLAPVMSVTAQDFTLHASWVPDGFVIQRGDKLEQLDYHGHKDVQDLAVTPDGTRAIALRKYRGKMISSPEGLDPDLVVLDLKQKSSRILPIIADAVAASDANLAVAVAHQLSHLVDDKLVPVAKTAAYIDALAYSPDGRVLAVGGRDGTIAIYAGADLVAMLRGHTLGIRRLIWHGSQLLSIADDQTLIWSF